ncbi:HAD family hydrolase [Paenibacillus bovis]|uniref:HAD family hydrolase n=1 Tax=Paenibacillus bovis TaxID=1616788 RepID=A0A172ZB99_9BACL|nr:HAD family hydrolase [Paenibacillus bovis]ANF94773.1 HAD family hydrolase [Paenibacillus bovis]
MKIKAIIFDFDGLILDTESVWFECYQEILSRYEMELTLEHFAPSIGTHGNDFIDYVEKTIGKPGIGRIIDQEVYVLHQQKMQLIEAREGVADYLHTAREMELRIGLATSSNRAWIERFLGKLGLREYFEVIKTSDDVSAVKPDPELYLRVVDELGVKPEEALAFEDSLNGLRAAKAAGLHCAIVPNPVTSLLPFEHYDLRLDSMAEMPLGAVLERIIVQSRL